MAFEITDFDHHYVPRGGAGGIFNVVRSDEDSDVERYYCYMNEAGSYFIQQMTTVSTVTHKVYKYYATRRRPTQVDTDWTNRASLTYVEYNVLFPSSQQT